MQQGLGWCTFRVQAHALFQAKPAFQCNRHIMPSVHSILPNIFRRCSSVIYKYQKEYTGSEKGAIKGLPPETQSDWTFQRSGSWWQVIDLSGTIMVPGLPKCLM